VAGLAASFGSGAMTNSIAEIERAGAILVTGSNTTEMHPVIATSIKRAVRKRGTKLILVDPRRITLERYSERWLRPKPGTDVAWINGLMHVILSEGLQDDDYIADRTEGFEAVREAVREYTPDRVEAITGIPAGDLIEAGRAFGRAKTATILYAMGITQHTTGTDNVKSLANLALLTGNVGVPNAGVNPLRGQNNVQGACDMGALPNVYSGYQKVDESAVRDRMAELWEVPSLPDRSGRTVTEITDEILSGEIRALYIVGENPMLSDPDLHHVEQALRKVDLLVVQDIFLTETAKLAHVVLPGASFAEKDGTFTNTERRVQRVRKAVESPGDARADWEIVSDLSTRMGYPMAYESPGEIMDEIAAVTPSYGGIRYSRIERTGLQWPCPTLDHHGTRYLHKDGFTRGRGAFHAVQYHEPPELPDEDYPLYLSTGRVLYHWHTGSMTRRSAGMVNRVSECEMEISPEDAVRYGIGDGSSVRVRSRRGEISTKAKITKRAVRGTVFIPFHFAESAVNELTHGMTDPVAKIPGLKVCAVSVESN
jgi:formate dehydrogenase alpha subunit